jgi:hypothetical protein
MHLLSIPLVGLWVGGDIKFIKLAKISIAHIPKPEDLAPEKIVQGFLQGRFREDSSILIEE